MTPKPVTYQLLIQLKKGCDIVVGALGEHHFPPGYYLYTGSAKRNMAARLERHCRKEKPLRWHIDYLTSHPEARVISSTVSTTSECCLNQTTAGKIIVAKLGASDCRKGCISHLKFMGRTHPQLTKSSTSAKARKV